MEIEKSQILHPYLSRKIKVFHAVGIVFVILNHCGFQEMLPAAHVFSECFANCSRWAVCMYFVLSGYLLFNGIDRHNLYTALIAKYKRRVWSLLVPLSLWSLFGTFLYTWLYQIGFRDEWTLMAHDFSQGSLLRLFLHPGMLQMWFVRDLIWCALLAVPLYFLVRIFRCLLPLSLLLVAYLYDSCTAWYFILSYRSLAFFCFGAYASIQKWNIDTRTMPRWSAWVWSAISFGLFIYLAFFPYENPLLIAPLMLACFGSAWMLYDYYPAFFDWLCKRFSLDKYSFFMFASFEPFYYLSKYIVISFLGSYYTSYSIVQISVLIVMYFVAFFTTNMIARFFNQFFPRLYSLLTGGRR